MKVIVYNSPRGVQVKDMPDPQIKHPNGRENFGLIAECGPAVKSLKVGDAACIPFNASCGFCKNCERGLTGACLTLNPGSPGAGYGYAGMGELQRLAGLVPGESVVIYGAGPVGLMAAYSAQLQVGTAGKQAASSERSEQGAIGREAEHAHAHTREPRSGSAVKKRD